MIHIIYLLIVIISELIIFYKFNVKSKKLRLLIK